MNIYKDVSLSHTSTSESEAGGGEGVETTLKVLAALQSVQDNIDVPASPTSRKSRDDQSAKSNSKTMFVDSFAEIKSKDNAKQSDSSRKTMSSMSSSASGPHKHKKGQYPVGIAPLSPQRNLNNPMPPPTTQRGGLFSCCFRANEQVVVQGPPRRQESKNGNNKTYDHQVYPENKGQEEDNEEQEAGGDPRGLTDYERAMIQRLRELLSLDTTVPTLPTHIQVNALKDSPVSLDITDSMIANTFSIDTKELQSVLQGEQNKTVVEMSNQGGESARSTSLASQALGLALESKLRSFSSSIVPGIEHPPSMQSTAKPSAASVNDGSLPKSGSTTHSRTTNASKQLSTNDRTQSIQNNQSHVSQSRSTRGTGINQAASREENATMALHRAPSKGSKASSQASSHSSRKGSTAASSRQPSISERSKTLMSNRGVGRSGSFVGSSKGIPPKPESDGMSQDIQESMLALKKSSSIKSGSVGTKSKKSFASRAGAVKSKCSSSSSREMSVMPDVPMVTTNDVSIKRSKSSKSTSTSASVGQVSKQPSLRYSSSNSSSHHSLHRRSSHESNVHETRQEVEEQRVLPPRPEAQRKRKDPMETIVAAYSNHREEPDEDGEDGGFECIYPVDVEEDDPPELEATHSEEVVRRDKYKSVPHNMRRATSEIVRIGPIQPIRRSSSREPSTVLGAASLDGNAARAPTKDFRDDISDLGMLSPKRMAAAQAQDDEEKENVVVGEGTVVVGSEPRKMDMLDMFSGGYFCLGGSGNAAANAVI